MDGNYIKINRTILDWEWYGNINTKLLFFHILLKANWRDGKFEGSVIPRGSFVSSYPRLAEECSLTINELRTALKHLVLTGEITVKAYPKYSVFTVKNYCEYQDVNSQITGEPQADHSQTTGKPQSINSLLTTIEERKKEKKDIKNNICAFETEKDVDKKADAVEKARQMKVDVTELFESVWALYPHKRGKSSISYERKKELYKTGYDKLAIGISRYSAEWEKDKEWRKPLYGSTFFGGKYVDYIADDYKPLQDSEKSRPAESKGNQFQNFPQRDTIDYDDIIFQGLQAPGEDDNKDG